MIQKIGFAVGFLILIVLCILSDFLLLPVAFPFMVLTLQKLGVVPK